MSGKKQNKGREARGWLIRRNKAKEQGIDTYIGEWRVPFNRTFVTLFDYKKGTPNKSYLISDYGEIISFKSGKPKLKAQFPKINKDKEENTDYLAFNIYENELYTHVAVLFSFAYQYYFVSAKGYPKPQCSEVINSAQDFQKFIDDRKKNKDETESLVHHKDFNRRNNRLSNLLLTYNYAHKAYHDINKLKHDEDDATSTIAAAAAIQDLDFKKPTLIGVGDTGSLLPIMTLEEEDANKFGNEFIGQKSKGNAVIVWHERNIKEAVFDKWREKIEEDPTIALHPQCIVFDAQSVNTEIFYRIPKSEEWQDLPPDQFFTFDFIKRIPRRQRGILARVTA